MNPMNFREWWTLFSGVYLNNVQMRNLAQSAWNGAAERAAQLCDLREKFNEREQSLSRAAEDELLALAIREMKETL